MNNRTPGIAAGLGHAVKAALLVAGGCAFDPRGADTPGDDAPIDAADGAPAIDAIDGAPAALLCDPGDTTLLLCMSFDDGSARNQVAGGPEPVTPVNVGSVPGRVGPGGGFGDATVLRYLEDTRLDLREPYAFEMFVKLDQPPATTGNARIGILDNDSQFSLFARVRDQGDGPKIYPYCNAQATVFGATPLDVGTWHHLACVQDNGALTIYVDGVGVAALNATPTNTTGDRGTTIGQDCDSNLSQVDDPVIGAIDELRLWTGARTAAQIQAAAARR